MITASGRPGFAAPAKDGEEGMAIPEANAPVEEYLSWKESYTKSAHRAYRVWVTRFQHFVGKPPEAIRHTDYAAFANSLRGRYAPKGIQFALNVVRNYLRYFSEQHRLGFPLYLIRVPRAASRSHPAISEGDYRKLIATARARTPEALRDIAILMLLHDTGMRIGELLSLRPEDIEEDMSAVVKTEKATSFRRVFWNPETDAVLQSYLVERINRGPASSDYLFVTGRKDATGAINRRSVQRMLKRYLSMSGLSPRLCLHSFRHGFIHRLAKVGVIDAIIAKLVGHSTPHTIAHYTVLTRSEYHEYAQRQLALSLASGAVGAAA